MLLNYMKFLRINVIFILLWSFFNFKNKINYSIRFCEGGELFDRIIAKGHFSEHEARLVFT